ncbi:hypothetical protein [Streptomyces sp. TP-A0874]|uniref:hypothetical protein n=1 Tax=Streptomyces sp. TP-A0874 TaxID=549819 RepID=UPI00099FF012|nr:hypothetical protein [Streptomyces sp. TP-A0874]
MLLLSRSARRRAASERWNTWPAPKARVLGVARTLTSATRLLDVLSLLRPEDGIEISYTVNPGSVFSAGLDQYLADVGARVLPWREATRQRFDLAVACAVNTSMRRLRAPLLVLPHGAGYNRLVQESTGDTVSPAGLSPQELMHRGKVVPAAIGVSHEEQLERLGRVCPPAVPRALVVGDWCFDRIRASLPLRDVYREHLGVGAGRRLVVLHSTWSEHSLLGRNPDLPLRLVTALPVDEFATAAVLHPNVWARYGPLGVSRRLADAVDAGLMLIPPQEGWRAATIAGDVVIGDHGSTSFYGAALDRATLLAATGLDELDPASPAAAFGRQAPRLAPGEDLYRQLRDAIEEHTPGRLAPIVDRQLGAPGQAGQILQRRMYEFFAQRGLRPPSEPPLPRPVPPPRSVRRAAPATFDVTGGPAPDGAVEVRRRPVVRELHGRARGFYVVTDRETHRLWPGSTEVVARTVVDAELSAVDWVHGQAAGGELYNVLVAALGRDRCLVRLHGGRLLEASSVRPWGSPVPDLDPVLLGAAVNLWWLADPTREPVAGLLGGGLRIRTGATVREVAFTAAPGV